MTIRYPSSDQLTRKSTDELRVIYREAVQVAIRANLTPAECDETRHTAEAIRRILMQRARFGKPTP